MYTAMLTAQNIVHQAGHDIWAVNVEEEYLEEQPSAQRVSTDKGTGGAAGTGRSAPIVPSTARRAGSVG